MAIFESIIGAGASLLGGVFGKKKQETSTTVDYHKLMTRAIRGGFNPLTALRNGGSAGFSTTTAPTVSTLPDVLGNVGGALGQALDNRVDPLKRFPSAPPRPDTALVDQQLRNPWIAGSSPRLYAGGQFTGTKVAVTKPAMGPSTFKSDMGYVEGDTPTVTNPYGKGFMKPDPNTPDASVYEDRLGDGIDSPATWIVGPSDLGFSIDSWFTDRNLPMGPTHMGAMIRNRISDLWTKPGTRKTGRGTGLLQRNDPPGRPAAKTRVGRYKRNWQ